MLEIKLAITNFFDSIAAAGGVPWEHYIDDFSKADFGLALRIEEDLARQNRGIAIIIAIAVLILSIFAISILWNQHKLKKMLKKLLEDKTSEKDKP